jgi:hypothetical protein
VDVIGAQELGRRTAEDHEHRDTGQWQCDIMAGPPVPCRTIPQCGTAERGTRRRTHELMVRPDRRIVVQLEPLPRGPVHVLHPCRCDAPDPEAARMEPLEVPLVPLLAEGRCLVVCPECDYHLLAVAAEEAPDDEPERGTTMSPSRCST